MSKKTYSLAYLRYASVLAGLIWYVIGLIWYVIGLFLRIGEEVSNSIEITNELIARLELLALSEVRVEFKASVRCHKEPYQMWKETYNMSKKTHIVSKEAY